MTFLNNLLKEYYKIIPDVNMNEDEILYSLIRFSLILILIYIFIRSKPIWFFIPFFILVSCMLLVIGEKKENITENKHKCKNTNINNPYMNYTYGQKNMKLCEKFNKNLQNNYYKYNLYRNVSDIFDKDSLKMQFYTMPVTNNINDTNKLANLLYNTGENCKSSGVNCLKYRNVKYH